MNGRLSWDRVPGQADAELPRTCNSARKDDYRAVAVESSLSVSCLSFILQILHVRAIDTLTRFGIFRRCT
jgi:hypothetical protein